jgi:hypothetical protein
VLAKLKAFLDELHVLAVLFNPPSSRIVYFHQDQAKDCFKLFPLEPRAPWLRTACPGLKRAALHAFSEASFPISLCLGGIAA